MIKVSSCIEFQNVSKEYGRVKAISSLNFKIEEGERVALLGCNGAGKSTAIGLACGLRPTTSGEVLIFGHKPGSVEAQKQLRVLPQELDFPEYLKVIEVLSVVNAHFKNEDIVKFCDLLQITPLLHRRCSALSGGEKKKIGLICTLLGDPAAILLDEPTSNIDLGGRGLIYRLLDDFLSSTPKPKTLIFSSHQMQEVETLATRIIVLNRGLLVADGSPAQIRKKYGLKKIVIDTPTDGLKLDSIFKIVTEKNKTLIFGENSDEILQQLYSSRSNFSGVEIHDASLDEIFLKLWTNEGAAQ